MKSRQFSSLALAVSLIAAQAAHALAQTNANDTALGASVAAAASPAAAPAAVPRLAFDLTLSSSSREVVKLVTGGISTDVVKAYIDNSASAFNLTADGILKLQSSGVPNSLVTAMMAHDKELRDRGQLAALQPPQPQLQYPPPDQSAPMPMPPQVSAPPYGYDPQTTTLPPDYNDLSPYGSWYYDQPDAEWYWSPYPSLWNYGYPWGFVALNNGRWWYHHNHGWVWSHGGTHAGRTYYSAPPFRGGGTQVFAHPNLGGVQTTVIHPGFNRGGGTVAARISGGYGSAGVAGHH